MEDANNSARICGSHGEVGTDRKCCALLLVNAGMRVLKQQYSATAAKRLRINETQVRPLHRERLLYTESAHDVNRRTRHLRKRQRDVERDLFERRVECAEDSEGPGLTSDSAIENATSADEPQVAHDRRVVDAAAQVQRIGDAGRLRKR